MIRLIIVVVFFILIILAAKNNYSLCENKQKPILKKNPEPLIKEVSLPSLSEYQITNFLNGYKTPNYLQENIWLGTAKLQPPEYQY